MNVMVTNSLRFILLVFLQVLVLNQIEIGFGIQLMVYPIFILLLPVELGVVYLMLAGLVMGLAIDAMSNTYGLHASSLVAFAYLRPLVFKLFAPRDGYDSLLETNIFNMGTSWFLRAFGLLLIIHHLWFFMLEMFKMSEILYVLQKTALSAPISFLICILLQYLFVKRGSEK